MLSNFLHKRRYFEFFFCETISNMITLVPGRSSVYSCAVPHGQHPPPLGLAVGLLLVARRLLPGVYFKKLKIWDDKLARQYPRQMREDVTIPQAK
jgi:hypothetical protein